MKRVLCILETGFEEIETITPIDLLRRAGIEVMIGGCKEIDVTGRSGITVKADALLESVDAGDFDGLFLPGGPAVMKLRQHTKLLELIRHYYSEDKIIAAICAAPLLLKDAGVLDGKVFTAHFSTQEELPESTAKRVVIDGNLITSRGAGTALDFGLALIEKMVGKAAADEVSSAIMS